MTERSANETYSFHGVGLSIHGDPDAASLLHGRLRHFSFHAPVDGFVMTFGFSSAEKVTDHHIMRPPRSARSVYQFPRGKVAYLRDSDQLYVDFDDRVRVMSDLGRGEVQLSFLRADPYSLWLAAHPLFTLPLVELLKRRGVYGLHAAGVCVGGKGLLLTGPCGSGKTTLALALLRAGFDFLGDNTLFLAAGREGFRVLAFPDEADVTDQTVCLFPELQGRVTAAESPQRAKRRVQAELLYRSTIAWSCTPAAIIFPRVAGTATSVLTSMGPDEALIELLPNILQTDVRTSQAHLEILAMLASQGRCYRLDTGHDFGALPRLLGSLLE
jgi:hypothetical protein